MMFVVPSTLTYSAFPLVGGPINGKQVLAPCDGTRTHRGFLPTENARSVNISIKVAASIPGPYHVNETDPDTETARYVYAAEVNSFVFVERTE